MKNVMNSIWNWIKLSTFIFALSTFVSCEQSEDFVPQETTRDIVKVTANIGDTPATRVHQPEDNLYAFSVNDKIRIVGWFGDAESSWDSSLQDFVNPSAPDTYQWYNEATSTYDGFRWNTEPPMCWQNIGFDGNPNPKHYFLAWWPEHIVSSAGNLKKVHLDVTGMKDVPDILVARWEGKQPDDNTLGLEFNHLLARIDVNLEFGTQYTNVSDVSVIFNNVITEKKTIDLTTGTIPTPDNNDTDVRKGSVEMIAKENPTPGYYWSGYNLVIPQRYHINQGVTVKFTTDGEKKELTLNRGQYLFNFNSGKRARLIFTVGDNKLTLTEIETDEGDFPGGWNNEEEL